VQVGRPAEALRRDIEPARRRERQQQAESAAERREQPAFDEQLADDVPAARANRLRITRFPARVTPIASAEVRR
jgi:hypothetical protein